MSLENYQTRVQNNFGDVVSGVCRQDDAVKNKGVLIMRQALTHAEFGLACGEVEKPRLLLERVRALLRGFSWDAVFYPLSAEDERWLRVELETELQMMAALLCSGDRGAMALAVERIRAQGFVSSSLGEFQMAFLPKTLSDNTANASL